MCTDTCPFTFENDSTSFEKLLLTVGRSHVSCNAWGVAGCYQCMYTNSMNT